MSALERRHKRLGRLLVGERIERLFDAGSFVELGASHVPGDALITGVGRVCGRAVATYAHDPLVDRGALGVNGAKKIIELLDLAASRRLPVVSLLDSDGVRIGEGPAAMEGFADVLGRIAELSGRVPQIGVVLGLCVGGAAYGTALQDLVVGQADSGYCFVTGPSVTKVVTGEDVAMDALGGVTMHAATTGLVHAVREDEAGCLDAARELLGYLGADGEAVDPIDRATPGIKDVLPESERRPYDVRRIVAEIVDAGSFFELQSAFAKNLVIGFARLDGRTIGVVASQPMHLAGALDCDASRKGARFIHLCSAYDIPVLTLVDVPGFLPGAAQERGGLLLHGAKLIYAYARCRSPLVSLVMRKAYGGGSVLALPAAIRFGYPTTRFEPMGGVAARTVRGTLDEAYEATDGAAAAGVIHRTIDPSATRLELARALTVLRGSTSDPLAAGNGPL